MTTISPKRKQASNRLKFLSWLGLFVLVLGLVAALRTPLSSLLWRALEPISKTREAALQTMGSFFSSFSTTYALVAENERLRTQLASSSILLLDRTILENENLELKARLGRIPAHTPVLLASVITRPGDSPYDTLMIDVGSKSGVAPGDLVAAGGSVYIGRVGDVYASVSTVVLFSAPGESYKALLMEHTTGHALAISVAGQGGSSLTAEVPAGTPVEVGDSVVFPDITPQFFARVTAIQKENQASFTRIFLEFPVNIYTLRFVEIHTQSSYAP